MLGVLIDDCGENVPLALPRGAFVPVPYLCNECIVHVIEVQLTVPFDVLKKLLDVMVAVSHL